MLQVHGELTELFATVLEFAKRKRLAGQPPGGSIEIMTRAAHLRPLVEMLDDADMRELADKALDLFAKVAKRIAPDPGEQESTREEAGADLEATREALNDLAARIGEATRL